MYRRILVAFDGSPESRLAVDECSHLMQVSGREIHLVCVLHDPSPYLLAGEFVPEPALAIDRSRMEADLKDAASRLTERGFSVTTHLQDGEPVDVITRLVDGAVGALLRFRNGAYAQLNDHVLRALDRLEVLRAMTSALNSTAADP